VLVLSAGRPYEPLRILLAAAIMIWAARLGGYLFYRIMKIGKDERFDDKRSSFVEFLKFWVLQALVVWLVMLPSSLFLVRRTPAESGIALPLTGFALFLAGLIIEAVSDVQKFRYKLDPGRRAHWVDVGLWRLSRHPNYFGEILLWWGLFLVVVPSLEWWGWFTVIGPLTITVFLLFVSGIPLLEKSGDKKYGSNPEYLAYKERTSLLIPLPPRRSRG
jgi:steroid 5-alpha reductase family enzyme